MNEDNVNPLSFLAVPFIFTGPGVLCVSTDSVSSNYCHIKIYMARDTLVRLNLAGIGLPLGNQGIIHFHWSICEERKKIACFISSIFLLSTFGVVDPVVLTYTQYTHINISNDSQSLFHFYTELEQDIYAPSSVVPQNFSFRDRAAFLQLCTLFHSLWQW